MTNWQKAQLEASEHIKAIENEWVGKTHIGVTAEQQARIDVAITETAKKYGVPEGILRKNVLWEAPPPPPEQRIPMTEKEVEEFFAPATTIKLYRTTRGFEEDAALRADLETKQGYKLYAVFDTPEEAQEVAKQLAGQDIKFVKHISTPETGEHQTWEIYAKPIPQADLYWYSISELKQMCREGGLSTEGSKEQLITRLKRA